MIKCVIMVNSVLVEAIATTDQRTYLIAFCSLRLRSNQDILFCLRASYKNTKKYVRKKYQTNKIDAL